MKVKVRGLTTMDEMANAMMKLGLSSKDQYMALRKARTGLVLDQIAFYAPDSIAEANIKKMLGIDEAEWTVDHVSGRCRVFGGDERESTARLQFNYDLGIEVEILRYLSGPHWHLQRAISKHGPNVFFGSIPFVSHIGFHVNDEELPNLPFQVAQEMVTVEHSNPAIAGRSYQYVIYDTKDMLGVDLKYIKRLA